MESIIITLIIVAGICQIVKYVMAYLTYRITVNADESNPVVNYVKNGEPAHEE